MKLNELVRLRNQLANAIEVSTLNIEIEKNCTRLLNLTTDIDEDLAQGIIEIANDHRDIGLLYQRDCDKLKNLLASVQDKINQFSLQFFAENYQLELKYLDPDSIRVTRSIQKDEEFEQVLIQRINLYSNWQYPALEIGCRDGQWTKLLVASDPLYIADVFPDFLSSAVQQFPPLYQGRVRKYLIHDFYKISNLPKNQFGLIFSYNFFNYLSIDSIKQLLIQSMEWLRPGGTILFTYNNADLPAAAAYAENYFMTYVPESILIPMAESIGFETVFIYNCEPAYSIIELRKPGTLKSVKVGQTVGEIKHITN
jgi:SAM-dependent methyltransferase